MSPLSRVDRRRAIRRRQTRIVTVVCVGFCILVLATSFPAAALLRQRHDLSTASSELSTLNSQIRSLQSQDEELSQPQNIAAIARRDYGMVRPGQTAYRILPTSSQESSNESLSGNLDQGPVMPGSAQSLALDGAGPGLGQQPLTTPGVTSGSPAIRSGSATPGLWSRVLGTLEFWR
jgi:cell division protein FtsB